MTRAATGLLVVMAVAAALVNDSGSASAQHQDDAPEGIVWLALGDSYSSGEGLRYPDSSENPPGRNCERATGHTTVNGGDGSRAYAKVAYDEMRGDWVDSHFELLACTGDVSNQIHQRYTQEWDADSRRADLVTISMGGNNIRFADVIFGCVGVTFEDGFSAAVGERGIAGGITGWFLSPSVGCKVSENELRQRIDALFADEGSGPFGTQTLPQMYREMERELMNQGGHVIVTGYPNLVEESGRWTRWLFEGNRCHRIRRSDTSMLRSVAGYINQRLALLTDELERTSEFGIQYHWVDTSVVYENAETGRHGLCAGNPWINGITLGIDGSHSESLPFRMSRSFHPKQEGHDALGREVARVIREEVDWSTLKRGGAETSAAIDVANGTLAGFGLGPVSADALIAALSDRYGKPDHDTGWGAHDCWGTEVVRYVSWNRLGVYFADRGGELLDGFSYSTFRDGGPPETDLNLPAAVRMGMSYAEATAIDLAGAHRMDTLEMDVASIPAPHSVQLIAAVSDGSAPIDGVWVGFVPVCS